MSGSSTILFSRYIHFSPFLPFSLYPRILRDSFLQRILLHCCFLLSMLNTVIRVLKAPRRSTVLKVYSKCPRRQYFWGIASDGLLSPLNPPTIPIILLPLMEHPSFSPLLYPTSISGIIPLRQKGIYLWPFSLAIEDYAPPTPNVFL